VKVWKLCVVILCFLFPAMNVNAAKVTVVTEEYPPYNYTENGKVTGVFTEIVEAILKTAGVDYTITAYPWTRSYDMALKNSDVLIYGIVRTPERETLFKWVEIIMPFDIYFFKLKDRKDIQLSDLEDAKKYSIGVVRGDVREQYFQSKGFMQLDPVRTNELNLEKFYNKRFDLIAIDEISAAYFCKKGKYDFSGMERIFHLPDLSKGLYIAFSKNTSDSIVEKCRNAFQKIKADGNYDTIRSKYLK
jgi:polar amino acid transport system substrate-binding protein